MVAIHRFLYSFFFPKLFFHKIFSQIISITDEIYPHQERQVRDYIIHEDYRRGSQFNDIALLILIQPVDIAENVNVICLPQQADMFDGSRCIASGWGKDRFGANGRYQVGADIEKWTTIKIPDHLVLNADWKFDLCNCRWFWSESNYQ